MANATVTVSQEIVEELRKQWEKERLEQGLLDKQYAVLRAAKLLVPAWSRYRDNDVESILYWVGQAVDAAEALLLEEAIFDEHEKRLKDAGS